MESGNISLITSPATLNVSDFFSIDQDGEYYFLLLFFSGPKSRSGTYGKIMLFCIRKLSLPLIMYRCLVAW